MSIFAGVHNLPTVCSPLAWLPLGYIHPHANGTKSSGKLSFTGIRALVVGQGSIGRRHARLLQELGADVATVSAKAEGAFRSLDGAFSNSIPDYVVVANETSAHVGTIADLNRLRFQGRMLVEKPLAVEPMEVELGTVLKAAVAYNLRFHPVVSALRSACRDQIPVEIRMHVGQYLPDWRPGVDLMEQSSARKEAGGGVLRDLSHEIDLLLHLFGPWRRLVSIGGNRGLLGIETDEVWSILLELASGAQVALTLNYLDRQVERRITVNTRHDTVQADLIAGTIRSTAGVVSFSSERDDTYREQHMAMLRDSDTVLCSIGEAVEVMQAVAMIERSASERTWVER